MFKLACVQSWRRWDYRASPIPPLPLLHFSLKIIWFSWGQPSECNYCAPNMFFPTACLLQNTSAFTGTWKPVFWLGKIMHNIHHTITYVVIECLIIKEPWGKPRYLHSILNLPQKYLYLYKMGRKRECWEVNSNTKYFFLSFMPDNISINLLHSSPKKEGYSLRSFTWTP